MHFTVRYKNIVRLLNNNREVLNQENGLSEFVCNGVFVRTVPNFVMEARVIRIRFT